jgi:hypothetical protein
MAACSLRLGRLVQAVRQLVARVKSHEAAIRADEREYEQSRSTTSDLQRPVVGSDSVKHHKRVCDSEVTPNRPVTTGAFKLGTAGFECAPRGFMVRPRPAVLHYVREPKARWFRLPRLVRGCLVRWP